MKTLTFIFCSCLIAVALKAQEPVISIDPQSMVVGLFTGDTSNQEITVSNSGTGDLSCTITVEPTSPGGSINNALKFDGTNDYGAISNPAILQLSGQLTIEAWISFEAGGTGKPTIISKGRPLPDYEVFLDTTLQTSAIGLRLNQVGTIVSQALLTAGNDYHVAFTYNGTMLSLYINGILDNTQAGTGLVSTSSYGFYLGKRDNSTANRYKGEIDELRIWSIARSPVEILQDINHELSGSEQGLAGYWKFNEESGNKAYDATANANNVTLYNGVLRVSSGAAVINWLDVSPVSMNISPGNTAMLDVSISAAGLNGGTYTGQVSLRSNDPISSLVVVPVALVVTPIAHINLSLSLLDFGNVFVGASKTMPFIVSNSGNGPLEVTSITCPDPDYVITPLNFSVPPGESDTVEVTYTPSTPGNDNATLTILSNDLLHPEVSLALTGMAVSPPVISVSPDSLHINLYSGTSGTQNLTITNSGLSDLTFTITDYVLVLDGYEDYVRVGNPSLYALDQFTLEAWIYKYDYNFGGFIALGNATSERFTLHCGWGNNNMMYWQDWPDNYAEVNTYSFYAGTWIHLAVAHDGTVLKCYTNGNLVNSVQLSSPSTVSSNHFLYFGNQISGNPEYLYGKMDDIRIWDYARSQEEIQQYMTNDLTGLESGLVGYWKFDEASGNVAYDASVNGNNGTLHGNACREAMPSFPTWFAVTPPSGICPPDSSMDIEVNYNASNLPGGDYQYGMNIFSNDPVHPTVTVPVTLHIMDAPCIRANLDTLDFGILYTGYDTSDSLQLVITNTGSLDLLITGVSASPSAFTAIPGFAGIDPGETETFTVIFTPLIAGNYSGVLTFTSNDPLAGEYSVVLKGQFLVPPEISVNPPSLNATLYSGKTTTQSFTINNTGGSDLGFTISPGTSKSLQFDGMDDYMEVPSLNPIQNTPVSQFTFECWVFFNALNNTQQIMQALVCYSNYWLIIQTTPDRVVFALYDDGWNYHEVYSTPLQSGTWVHLAFTYNGNAQKIFINGIENASVSWSGTFTFNNGLTIGKTPEFSGEYLDGYMDEVRLWNVARTAGEIRQGMTRELAGSTNGLIGYWKLDEINGGMVEDVTGYNNDAALYGNPSLSNFAPTVISWLSCHPTSGTCPAGTSMDIQADFNASYLAGGSYITNIVVYSTDPDEPELLIPATLQVFDAPSILAEQDTLDFGEIFTGTTKTLELVVENTGSMDLLIFSAEAAPAEYSVFPPYASIDPGEAETFEVTFSPLNVGDFPGTLTLNSNDPVMGGYIITLKGHGVEPPIISVMPDSLHVDLLPGQTTTEPFTIYNTGGSNLYFNITPGDGSQNFALDFDGNDDYINLGDNINLANSSITLEAWAKERPDYGARLIWGQGSSGYGNMCLHVGFRESNVFTFAFYCDDLDTPSGYTDTEWHHWACTFDVSTRVRKIYRDGTEVANDISLANYQGSGTFYIGRSEWGGNFQGFIDDVRIWNVDRTQQEIQKHMSHKLLGNETGLVGYWDFDEGTGLNVYDKSPNGNNGTLINGVTWSKVTAPMSPAWLSVSQGTGTIPANSGLNVEAVFNAAGLEEGDYSATIQIASNDPANPLVSIPVLMTVRSVVGIDQPEAGSQMSEVRCHPNPFTSSTTFSYTLAGPSQVILSVFDSYGRLVAEPVNAFQQKGEQRIEWNADNLPAGVYFYTLLSGRLSENGKVVLIK